LRAHYEIHGSSVIAVQEVPPSRTRDYGIVAVDGSNRLQQIVEKPAPELAPSRLAVVGRYLLAPQIFDILAATGRGAGGEIQLTDGIARLLSTEPVYALPFVGQRYDCGSKLGYVQATIDYALADPALQAPLRAHLQTLR
jgi:UTP--glucose-1-phosphate uridylyltransferase